MSVTWQAETEEYASILYYMSNYIQIFFLCNTGIQEYLHLLQHPDVILGGEDDSQHAEGGEGESGRCTVSAGHAPAPLAEPYKHIPGMGFSRTWMPAMQCG